MPPDKLIVELIHERIVKRIQQVRVVCLPRFADRLKKAFRKRKVHQPLELFLNVFPRVFW